MIQPLWTSLWEIPDRRMEWLVFFGRWVEVIEVGLGRVGAGMRCGVQGAGRSRDRPGVRADGGGSAPVSALMP